MYAHIYTDRTIEQFNGKSCKYAVYQTFKCQIFIWYFTGSWASLGTWSSPLCKEIITQGVVSPPDFYWLFSFTLDTYGCFPEYQSRWAILIPYEFGRKVALPVNSGCAELLQTAFWRHSPGHPSKCQWFYDYREETNYLTWQYKATDDTQCFPLRGEWGWFNIRLTWWLSVTAVSTHTRS